MRAYQLIEDLGLEPREVHRNNGELYVNARELESKLRESPEVWGYEGPGGEPCADWEIVDSDTDQKRTLTGRLLCVKPIKSDTERDLLEWIVTNAESSGAMWHNRADKDNWIRRAKKLLASKKESGK